MAKTLHIGKENLIYMALWLLLFLAPAASLYFRSTTDSDLTFRWHEVFHIWTIFAVYLAIFLVHNFILAPLLIYRRRRLLYLVSAACLIAIFITFECMNRPAPRQRPMPSAATHTPGASPHGDMGRPPFAHDTPPEMGPAATPAAGDSPNGRQHKGGKRADDRMPPVIIGQADLVGVLMLVGLLGLNVGVKLYFKNEQDQQDMQKLENQNLQHQLEYLKYQINPHFFMNTLNNIHALVDINPAKAKTTIVELSRMMRYILYEGDKSLIAMQKEVEFLHNYVRLMKLRYTDKVTVDLDIPENLSDGLIPPLLLITFLENAFKHGVSYEHESFIHVVMDAEEGSLIFRCVNSKKASENGKDRVPSEGGLGLKNIRQRLDLIYGKTYSLALHDGDTTYEVSLRIPLRPAGKS